MKVAIYCRLSEEDKNKATSFSDSESIQNQKSMLINYSLKHGWDIYKIYSDDDYTGADRRRPEFNRLLEDAQKRRFDIILCKTQSRFTRELELVEKYIHGLFPSLGIRFISIVDNADTANKGNKKSRQINGLVNEWYLEDMSDNIKSVLTDKRKRGVHIGSFALYGYKKDPDKKGHLIIDEEAASIVREVFTLFLQGYGKTTIARILNDRGVPNPTEYKRLHGLRYRQPPSNNSTLWKYSTISNMLTNEMYIGNLIQGKYGSVSYKTKQNKPRPEHEWYRVEGTHEPIIDGELWNSVQALLKQRAKPFSTGKIGLFAQKVRCAGCGYTMRSSKSRGRRYLRCSCHHISKDACAGSFISVDKLEQTVLQELNRLADLYLDKNELEKHLKTDECFTEKRKQLKADICFYQKKKEEYTLALQNSYLDKVKGVISEKDYILFSGNFSAENKRLDALIDDMQAQLNKLDNSMQTEHSSTELCSTKPCSEQIAGQYSRFYHLDREIVDEMIDYISVSKRIPGTQIVPIEIHWNF